VELVPDEKQGTTLGLLLRAVAWYNSRGNRFAEAKGYTRRRVVSDNSSAYCIKPWRQAH
jgi:hypothetical protein